MSDTKSDSMYDDVLMTHDYDGIQEYDNPMPAWWTWIFVACVVWAGVYVVGINLNFLPDYQDDLRAEMEIQKRLEAQHAAEVPPVTPGMLAEAAENAEKVESGKGVYDMQCAACHGTRGEGQIGPNLTDNAWIHGPELADIHRVVEEGVPAKGMPAWGPILGRDELVSVIAYVASVRGSDLDGKAPEGKVYDEAPEAPGGDDAEADAPAEGDTAEEEPANDVPTEQQEG